MCPCCRIYNYYNNINKCVIRSRLSSTTRSPRTHASYQVLHSFLLPLPQIRLNLMTRSRGSLANLHHLQNNNNNQTSDTFWDARGTQTPTPKGASILYVMEFQSSTKEKNSHVAGSWPSQVGSDQGFLHSRTFQSASRCVPS